MLVITRKVNQQIVIGDGVRILVVAIRGRQVRIGIQAPAEVLVRRPELGDRPPADPAGPGAPGRGTEVRE